MTNNNPKLINQDMIGPFVDVFMIPELSAAFMALINRVSSSCLSLRCFVDMFNNDPRFSSLINKKTMNKTQAL